jgi:putative ABC transport system permease protein
MNSIVQDIRYGVRVLRRNLGLTIVAILTLALGIGANATIFSAVNAVLLKPLPYPRPEELVGIWETTKSGDRTNLSYPNFLDLRNQTHAFEQMPGVLEAQVAMAAGAEPVKLQAAAVSAELFDCLGVKPVLGRLFVADDDKPGRAKIAIISHRLWQNRLGAEPDVVGSSITINEKPFTVAGVLPPEFHFPTDLVDIWVPLGPNALSLTNRAVHILFAYGRLKSGTTLGHAQAELETVAASIQRQNPGSDPDHSVTLIPLQEQLIGDVRTPLLTLLSAVIFVLLIACLNVSNLLLGRAAYRQREIAIRRAVGAGRWRIVRQLLTESLILSSCGGAMGLVLSLWGVDLVARNFAAQVQAPSGIRIDHSVLAFTVAVSTLTGIVFGLAPALRASNLGLNLTLKGGSNPSAARPARHRPMSALIVAQVALSLILLVGAGLMLKSMWKLTHVPLGFSPDNLLVLSVSLPDSKYEDAEKVARFFRDLPDQIQALPGVESTTAVSRPPISGGDANGDLTIDGSPFAPGEAPPVSFRRILPNYFRVMGISVLRGREFDDHDAGGPPNVVIINDKLARRYWPGSDPIGKRIKIGPPEHEPWLTIVGIVGDVRNEKLDTEPAYASYEPHALRPWSEMNVLVRTAIDPISLAPAIRDTVRRQEPHALISDPSTMRQLMSASLQRRRFDTCLFGIFGAIAVVLSAIGIYAVISFSVSRRVNEIGIRMAVGASRLEVFDLVIGRTMYLVAAGCAIGLLASSALTRLIADLLFDVSPVDPTTLLLVTLFLSAVALLATLVPALRAARVDPATSLRYE